MSRQNIKKVIFFRSDSIHTYSRVKGTVDQTSIYRRPWSEQRYSFQSFLIIGKKIKSYTHRIFPQWQLLKAFLAAAIGLQSVPATPLGLLAHPSHSALPPLQLLRLRRADLTFGKFPVGKLQIWEVFTWEIVTWEVALGKMPLGWCLTKSVHYPLKFLGTLFLVRRIRISQLIIRQFLNWGTHEITSTVPLYLLRPNLKNLSLNMIGST